MAIPVQTQLFDVFLGEQTGIHSIALPEVFSSGGCKNLFIDKYGRAKKISGYSRTNVTAVTTDSGGSACMGRALTPYRSTGGGVTTRQVLAVFDDKVNEWELWKSVDDGITWTFVYDAGASSINTIPDFAQFGDTLYMCNGVINPKKWDGTTLTTAGRTQSPTPTASVSASVGNLSGSYLYKLLSVYTDGTRKAGSVSSAALNLQNKQGSLTWTADADVTVAGYEVYRTTGTGAVFYFTQYVDGRLTAAFTDNVSDLDILENRVMEEHGDPPPIAFYCEPHKQRMWWARTSTYPTRAYWSDSGLAEDVLVDNFLDFSDSETIGDRITGMLGNFDGRLVVFTERAIWTVSGTGNVIGNIVDWNRIHTDAATGCPTHRTMIKVPAGAKYPDQNGKIQLTDKSTVAYMSSLNDIRLFDGENDVVISYPEKTLLDGLNYQNRAKSFMVHDAARAEVTWVFPTSSASDAEPDTAVTWNYRWGIFYNRQWAIFGHAIELENATDATFLLGVSNSTTIGGRVYKLWDGNTFDGADITATWMTKTLYGKIGARGEDAEQALSQRKRWRWVDFLFQTEQTATLTIEWLQGHTPDDAVAVASKTINTASSHVLTSNGSRITSLTGSPIVVGSATVELRVILQDSDGKYLHHEGLRLRVGDSDDAGSWALEAMNIAYQILPGLQRRMQ